MIVRFERGGRHGLAHLHPAYFALVMATGIVAISARLHGVPVVPRVLFWLNALFFAALAIATVVRALRYPEAFAADLRSHSRGVGFFTAVAAAGVFGVQLAGRDALALAAVFWVLAAALWLAVTYGVLAALTVLERKPRLVEGLNGGWLVSVVATQSLSILTLTMIARGAAPGSEQPLLFAALVLWLGGGALYLWLMTLIFYRYTFEPMSPADLTPPYWINMGAVAISTLAGATLLQASGSSPLVAQLAPFVKGLTLFFWAIGTWWIPMLLVLGVWRYVLRRVPFRYDPLYWGGVFPLGMYSAATLALGQALDAPFLRPLSQAFLVAALVAWALTLVGLVDSFRGGQRAAADTALKRSRIG